MWDHSPTRNKWRDRTLLNRGVASPINCPHVSSMSSTRGAPHGCPRGPAWSRGHLPRARAPPVRHLATRGPPMALPRGLSASSHPRGGPARHVSARQHSHSPRHHLQVSTHFFRILNKKVLNKNQIKIQKFIKMFRNSYFSKYNSFLIQIFSIGSQILFFFNIISFKIYFERRNQDELQFT